MLAGGDMFNLKKRQMGLIKIWLAYRFPKLKEWWKKKHDKPVPLEPAETIRVRIEKKDMPKVGLVEEMPGQGVLTFWPKYRRFLNHSEIPHKMIYIDRSDWMEQIKGLDILIWRPPASPAPLKAAKDKIYAAEEYLGITTIPSYRDLWLYEEKINQCYALKALGLPVVDTYISHDKEETLAHLETAEYPMVWKVNTGFGSLGVFLMKNKNQGVRLVNKVFSQGIPTFWRYQRQKDYVYLQSYLKDCGRDIRIMAIGDRYFGLLREPDKGDFRASGAGHLIWEAMPEDALQLAREVQQRLGTDSVVVDMLCLPDTGELGVIEVSLFTGAISQVALKVDGKPGCYNYRNGVFEFKEGQYWTQELTLMETFKSWAVRKNISIQTKPY
jgi:glutathione synthase/RimK-type ligase-like ATP-grasp enzyme